MKKITLLLLLLTPASISLAQDARKVKDTRVSRINQAKMNQTARTFEANSIVPEKTNILVYDEKGTTLLRRYSGGSRVGGRGVIDCAEIPCPGTFKDSVVCWKCKERLMR